MTEKKVELIRASDLHQISLEELAKEQIATRGKPMTFVAAVREMDKRIAAKEEVAVWVFPSGRCYVVNIGGIP